MNSNDTHTTRMTLTISLLLMFLTVAGIIVALEQTTLRLADQTNVSQKESHTLRTDSPQPAEQQQLRNQPVAARTFQLLQYPEEQSDVAFSLREHQRSVIPLSSKQVRTTITQNLYPYGQCTWYANQRYHDLHGIFVPWTVNANAWQWTARAHEFGWHVSSTPKKGAIIVLQPWVQGAYGLGHVGVVEQVKSNGRVIASHMNWGSNPSRVVSTEFVPGPGVSFIQQTPGLIY